MPDYINQSDDFDSAKAEQLKKELVVKRTRDANLESDRKIIAGHWPLSKNSLKTRITERVNSINQKANDQVMSLKDTDLKMILTDEISGRECVIAFNDTTHTVLVDGSSFSFRVNGTDSGSFFRNDKMKEISIDELSQFAVNAATPRVV